MHVLFGGACGPANCVRTASELAHDTKPGYAMTSGRKPKDGWSIAGEGIYVQNSRTYQPPVASVLPGFQERSGTDL